MILPYYLFLNCRFLLNRLLLLILLMGYGLSISAFASENNYLSFGLGHFESSQLHLSPLEKQSSQSFSGRIALGYNQCLSRWVCVGPELGWGSYTRSKWLIDGQKVSLHSTGFDFQLGAKIISYRQIYSHLKAGVIYHRLAHEAFDTGAIKLNEGKIDAWRPIFSLGLGYTINSKIQVEMVYQTTWGSAMTYQQLINGDRKAPQVAGYLFVMNYNLE